MENKQQKNLHNNNEVSFASSLASIELNKNISDATIEIFNGMEILKKIANTYSNVSEDQTKGRMLEIIEATERNYRNKFCAVLLGVPF